MTYGDGTKDLAAALDTAAHDYSAHRRSVRAIQGRRHVTMRQIIGTGLVATGTLLLGRVDGTQGRAGPSHT